MIKSPVSHAGYGYAAEVAILDDKGKVAICGCV